MTEPTDDELDAVLCNQWPAFSMQATLVRAWVRAAMRDALAKWGTPPAGVGEPVAWYVTGCGRLLDEDEAKAEARHIGGTARAIPLYTAPQQEAASVDLKTMELAESVGLIGPASRTHDLHAAIQRFHDLICANATIKAAQMAAEAISEAAPQQDERVAYLERKLKEADSVLEDAARLDWLDQQCEAYGFQDIHEGNRWEISGPYANVRVAIDAERAAQEGGE